MKIKANYYKVPYKGTKVNVRWVPCGTTTSDLVYIDGRLLQINLNSKGTKIKKWSIEKYTRKTHRFAVSELYVIITKLLLLLLKDI
jgi:hypothetical protein